MDGLNEAMQAVSTVGFPVAACALLWRFINGALKELQSVVSDNSKVLDKVCEKLDLIAMAARNAAKQAREEVLKDDCK